MNHWRSLAGCLFAGLLLASATHADDAAIAAALASDVRVAADRERDARSHPDVIVGLLELEPGDTVMDVFAGGGYYSDILIGVVSPAGQVILHNNTPYSNWVEDKLQARYVDDPIPGITYLKSEVDDLRLQDASLDGALMVMSYHDLYYRNAERGWGDTDVALFFSQLFAAMKPGARLVVVDHAAAPGAGSGAAQELHRIDEAFARQDIESSGLRFVGSSDVLRNPADDHSKLVFDKSIRGQTDRFVLVFDKP